MTEGLPIDRLVVQLPHMHIYMHLIDEMRRPGYSIVLRCPK